MKKIIAITTSVLLIICFSTVSAHADRKTIEGFMLGTGVAILGTAIINGLHKGSTSQYSNNHHHREYDRYYHKSEKRYAQKKRHHRKYKSHRARGHWEVEKIWVEPVYEKRWNPGHYNRRGDWVRGRNEFFMIKDGYWYEKKMWVRY